MFEKGNKDWKAKRAPGGGRKKTPSTLMKEAKQLWHLNLLDVATVILNKAVNDSNLEAAMYIYDQIEGKSKQKTDISIKGGEGIGINTLRVLIEGMARRKIELENPPRPQIDADGNEISLIE